MDTIRLQKRGNLRVDSPLYLKLGSSRGGGEWVLFSVTDRTSSFSCGFSFWIYWWSSTSPISNGISKRFKELELKKLTERVELFLSFKRFKTKLWRGSSPTCLWLLWIPSPGLTSSAPLFFLEVPLHGSPYIPLERSPLFSPCRALPPGSPLL